MVANYNRKRNYKNKSITRIEELTKLKNNTNSKYTRLVITAITMRYYGYSSDKISKTAQLSNATIILYVRNWHGNGFKSLKDNRGGSISKLDAEIIDNLIHVAISHSPTEFVFINIYLDMWNFKYIC